jgi:putative phage-type endonuclease
MTQAYQQVCTTTDRERWLECRRTGIGASEAAAILGFNPWSSAFDVWAKKLQLVEEDESEAAYWGRVLEPHIAHAYARERKVKIRKFSKLLRSNEHSFMLATPDYKQLGDPPALLECKQSGLRSRWSEEAPEYVQVQVQHQLAVTGYQHAFVAALLGGNKLVWVEVRRNNQFINTVLIPAEEKFWQHVLSKTEPPVDASEATANVLKKLYPEDSGETIALPGSFIDIDGRRMEAKERIKECEKVVRECDNLIRAEMKEASFATIPGGVSYSYRMYNRAAYSDATQSVRRKEG